MKRFRNAIRRHPAIATSAAALLTLGAAEFTSWLQNPTEDLPADYCTSPYVSSLTQVDPSMPVLQAQLGFFTTGVVAKGRLAPDAYGIRVSFHAPNESGQPNLSRMISPDEVGNIAVKMAVADGPVQFDIQAIAPEGSATCELAPSLTFEYEGVLDYFGANAQLPYWNPGNGLPALAGIVEP